MKTSPLAGKPAPPGMLVEVPRLITAGLTSNPTIFDHALKNSTAYDTAIRGELAKGKPARAIYSSDLELRGMYSLYAARTLLPSRWRQTKKRKQQNMKKQTHTNLLIRSSLALALILAIWSPVQAQTAEPVDGKMIMGGKMMTETNMMQRCQVMKEQKEKMMADMKAQHAQLTAQIARMNSAPADKKMDLMAAIVTQMVEQQTAMNVRKAKMEEEMMQHMMQHMQMGKDSMSQCPMMKGMKAMDDKSGNAQKEQK